MNGFEPGIFDKLFDDASEGLSPSVLRQMSIEEMKAVVARDLEALLNTRIMLDDEQLKAFPECERSVATYGLNDFAGLSLVSHYDRVYICKSLQNAIARHETRLRQVAVQLVGADKASNSALCFGISALLILPNMQEPVSFDAMLHPGTLQYSVTKAFQHHRA